MLATAASRRSRDVIALLGSDSDALFQTIVGANPYAAPVLSRYLAVTADLVTRATSA